VRGKLLFIDDDEVFCNLLVRYFEQDYEVSGFTDPAEAVEHIRENGSDVVVTDLNMPGMDGIDVLRTVKAGVLDTDVIIMTAYGSIDTAVEAMKKGAYDFIVKPFTTDELSLQLKNLFEKRRLREENIHLKKFIDITYRPESIIGESQEMKEVYRSVEQVSHTDFTVLVTGESGTGKELVARAIHFSGRRKPAKILSIHCGALTPDLLEREIFGYERGTFADLPGEKKGLFEEADGGTVVFEEIGDLDQSLQEKLAPVLEKRSFKRIGGSGEIPFDVMVIATTSRDLAHLRSEGKFRNDLFYNNIFSLRIPPLRERKEDIPLLAEHFFSLYKNEFQKPGLRMSREAAEALKDYEWPGNVRELKGLFARVCLLEEAALIKPEHILKRLGTPLPTHEEAEKGQIRQALAESKGNMTQAARILDVSYETLRYRMKKFGIRLPRRGSGEPIWWDD
jgi:DNA-binding NtrC family response regulator